MIGDKMETSVPPDIKRVKTPKGTLQVTPSVRNQLVNLVGVEGFDFTGLFHRFEQSNDTGPSILNVTALKGPLILKTPVRFQVDRPVIRTFQARSVKFTKLIPRFKFTTLLEINFITFRLKILVLNMDQIMIRQPKQVKIIGFLTADFHRRDSILIKVRKVDLINLVL